MISSGSKAAPASSRGEIAGGHEAIGHERRRGQPKARFFAMASLLWFFPSIGALVLLVPDAGRWFRADNWISGLRSVAFEQWIAILILLMHAVFAVLARHFRRCEPFQEEAGYDPEPDPPMGDPG